MLRVALRALRFRAGAFIATFLAMTFGALIVMACGGLMETGIRTEVPAQRLAAAPLVVTGSQTYQLPKQNPDDPEEDTESGTLPERVRLDSDLLPKIESVPGVASAVGDLTFPTVVTGGPPTSGPEPSSRGGGSPRWPGSPTTSGRRGTPSAGAATASGPRIWPWPPATTTRRCPSCTNS